METEKFQRVNVVATYRTQSITKTLKSSFLGTALEFNIIYRFSDLIAAVESESLGLGLGTMFGKFPR